MDAGADADVEMETDGESADEGRSGEESEHEGSRRENFDPVVDRQNIARSDPHGPFEVTALWELLRSPRYEVTVPLKGGGSCRVKLRLSWRWAELLGLLAAALDKSMAALADGSGPIDLGDAPCSRSQHANAILSHATYLLGVVHMQSRGGRPPPPRCTVQPAKCTVKENSTGVPAEQLLFARFHSDASAVLRLLLARWADGSPDEATLAQNKGLVDELREAGTRIGRSLPHERSSLTKAQWRKQVLLLLKGAGGAFLQEEASGAVDVLENLCDYLLQWHDGQGEIAPEYSFEDMHTHAFAEDSVLKRILQLLWQLRDRRIDIRSRPRSSSLRTGKHPSYYKARFAVPAAASSDASSGDEDEELPARLVAAGAGGGSGASDDSDEEEQLLRAANSLVAGRGDGAAAASAGQSGRAESGRAESPSLVDRGGGARDRGGGSSGACGEETDREAAGLLMQMQAANADAGDGGSAAERLDAADPTREANPHDEARPQGEMRAQVSSLARSKLRHLKATRSASGPFSDFYVDFIHAVLGTGEKAVDIAAWSELGAKWRQLVQKYRTYVAGSPLLAPLLQEVPRDMRRLDHPNASKNWPYIPAAGDSDAPDDLITGAWRLRMGGTGCLTQEGFLGQSPQLFAELQELIGDWCRDLQLPRRAASDRPLRSPARAGRAGGDDSAGGELQTPFPTRSPRAERPTPSPAPSPSPAPAEASAAPPRPSRRAQKRDRGYRLSLSIIPLVHLLRIGSQKAAPSYARLRALLDWCDKVPLASMEMRSGLREQGFIRSQAMMDFLLKRALRRQATLQRRIAQLDVMLSIDNASFARPRKWQRLVAKMLLSQNMPYTAMGITELDARCATRPCGEPRSSQVPRYLCVTPGPYYKAAAANPCPCALTAVPVALPLPAGQAEFDALEWIEYDGTKEGAVVKWHEKTGTHLLDWDEHSLSLLTFVPKKQQLRFYLRHYLYHLALNSITYHDALTDMDGPRPEPRKMQFLEGVPGEPGEVRVAAHSGFKAHRERIYGHDGTPVVSMPCRPAEIDEVSALGNLQADLLMQQVHGHKYAPYAEVPEGDLLRPSIASDVATQTQHEANVRVLYNKIDQGTFSDASAARIGVDVLRRIKPQDETGARWHFRSIILSDAETQCFSCGGVEATKNVLGRSNFDPSLPGQAVKTKMEVAHEELSTRVRLLVRQTHRRLLNGEMQLPRVGTDAPSRTLLRAEEYIDALEETIALMNVDGEHRVQNYKCFDLYLPMFLDEACSAAGDFEGQELLTLYFLPYCDSQNNTNVVPSLCRLLTAPYERSERRNAIVAGNISVTLTRDAKRLADGDVVQERMVLLVKARIPDGVAAKHRARILEGIGGNQDLIYHLRPWARLHMALLGERRSSSSVPPSTLVERKYLWRLAEFVWGVIDPERPFDPSKPSELQLYLDCHVLKLDDPPCSAEAMQVCCWQWLDPNGGPPTLTMPAALGAKLPVGTELPLGALLRYIALEPRGSDGGPYRWGVPLARRNEEDAEADSMIGTVRVCFAKPPPLDVPQSLKQQLATFCGGRTLGAPLPASLVLLELIRHDSQPWIRLRWREQQRQRQDSSTDLAQELRALLPTLTVLCTVGEEDAASACDGALAQPQGALQALLALLAAGEHEVRAAPPPVSTAHVITVALGDPPPRARRRGLDVAASSRGGWARSTAVRRRTAQADRRNIHEPPPLPPSSRGEAQSMWWFLQHESLPRARNLSGMPRLQAEDPGAVRFYNQQLDVARKVDEAEESTLTTQLQARAAQMREAVDTLAPIFLADSKAKVRTEPPGNPGRPAVPRTWPAPVEGFVWAGPTFLGNPSPERLAPQVSEGDAVARWLTSVQRQHPRRHRVDFDVLLPVSRDEGSFDYSSLVGGDAAASRGEQVEQLISSAANVRTRQRAQQEADAEERQHAAAAARGREMRTIQERLGRLNSERCKIRQLATSASTRTANAHLLQGLDDEEAELVATLERLRLLAETESGRQPDHDACRRATSRPPPRRRSQPAAGSSSAASQAGGGHTQPTQVLQSVASAAQRVLRDNDSDASRSDAHDEGEETGAAGGASSEESEGGDVASSGSASSEDDMLDPSE